MFDLFSSQMFSTVNWGDIEKRSDLDRMKIFFFQNEKHKFNTNGKVRNHVEIGKEVFKVPHHIIGNF